MIISKININGPNQNEITLSQDSITIQGMAGTTGTITVTQLGTGAISASSSNTSICTTSVSGSTVTITSVGEGSATITINTAATTQYEAASTTCSVTTKFVSNILSENTPEIIQQVAQEGTGDTYWDIGDRTAIIPVSAFGSGVSSTNNMCAFIIGFDHNSAIEGSGITFQMGMTTDGTRIAFVDTKYNTSVTTASTNNYLRMSANYNSGGWKSCFIRNYIVPAFMSALPTAWQNVIRSNVTKYTNNVGYYSSNYSSFVTATTDSAFLLAVYEIFGATTSINTYESTSQKQYAYYANGNSKIMYQSSAATTSCSWWTRSPRRSTGTSSTYNMKSYMVVSTNGTAAMRYCYSCAAFAPAFVVG